MSNDNTMTPDEARKYIAWFSDHGVPGRKTTFIKTNAGIIHFANMTDEDAVWTAHALQDQIVKPATNKRKQ